MYSKSKRNRWIAKLLLIVFFVEPVIFTASVRPVQAQSNTASSSYDKAFSSYDGISQWGNAVLTSSPAIGSALKSCLNVVPTFTKKIKRLFSSNKAASTVLNDENTRSNKSQDQICLKLTPAQKFQEGYMWGDPAKVDGYATTEDFEKCREAQNQAIGATEASANLAAGIESIDVKDQQAMAELERIRKAQEVAEDKLDDTNKGISETNKKLDENQVRDNCMDSIAYSMTKTLLAGITEGTVNLINTGNFGDPFFIKDTQSYFQDIKKTSLKQVFGGLLDELGAVGEAQYPYLKNTYINLVAQQAPAPFRERTRFTLEQVLSGQPYNKENDPGVYSTPQASGQGSLVNAFKENFSVGGWQGWLALTQMPQNNPIGFGLLAQEEAEKQQTSAEKAAESELAQGDGFLSMKKCVEQRTINKGPFDQATGKYQYEKDLALGIEPSYTVKTRGITAKPGDPDCTKTEVTTPGKVLATRLDAVITSDVHQLELADQFNESLNLIFTAAFNKLTSEGLSALSSQVYGSWAGQATRQSFVERYNNAVNQGNSNNNSTSTLGTAELIYRRPQTSYNSSDFDITTDLFDQQVGCTIRPGILTTEKKYLQELKNSNNKNISPIYRLMPAMAELDYCIPGPTTNWEEMADEKYHRLADGIEKEGIAFVGSSEVPLSTYAEVGSQLGKINLQVQKRENISNNLNIGLGAATALAGVATSLLVAAGAASATGAGIIVGAVLAVAAVGVMIYNSAVKKRQDAADAKLSDVLNRAPTRLQDAIMRIFTDEAFTWGNAQLKLLNDDYFQFKNAVYKKFSDANSIKVAAEARPFVEDLPSYANNILSIQSGYDDEIKTQEQVVAQVEVIAKQVQDINNAVIARLPGGKLPELPKECKPAANQCPNTNTGSRFMVGSGTTTYTSVPASNYNPNIGNSYIGVATNGPAKVNFPKPTITYSFNFSATSATDYLITADIKSEPTTLSIKMKAPFITGEQEVYGLGPLDLAYSVSSSSILGKTISITGYNPNNETTTRSCTIKKVPNGMICDPIVVGPSGDGQVVDPNAGNSL